MIAKSILPITKIFENTRDVLKENNINPPDVEAKIIIAYVKGENNPSSKMLSNTKIEKIVREAAQRLTHWAS
jgi:hypothetical protein